MTPTTTISVIIPAWNRTKTIAAAIDSVLMQHLPALECPPRIIVVDDGSTDDLAAALRPYGARVTSIRHERNMGAAAARNTGVTAADGELIAFLDSDDVWLPDKLTRQVTFMHEHGFAASCAAVHLVRAGLRGVVWPRYASGALSRAELICGCFVSPGSTLVCRRSVFSEIGVFDPTMRRLEDWDWLLRFAQRYPLGFLAQPLARIEPSLKLDFTNAVQAIEVMQARHMPAMAGSARRRFAAALDFERAGAHYRRGDIVSTALMLLRSLGHSPLRNRAMAAVFRNRLARG